MLWMICYDISDDRVRYDVEKQLSAVGERVQWSVFECVLSFEHMEMLRARIAQTIAPERDSLRYYPLCVWCEDRLTWQGQGRRTEDPDIWVV